MKKQLLILSVLCVIFVGCEREHRTTTTTETRTTERHNGNGAPEQKTTIERTDTNVNR